MPVVGLLDISAGLLTLLRPMRAVFLYMTAWSIWTALLRPLAGESMWEAFERAGNYGVPLALLLWAGLPRSRSQLFATVHVPALDQITRDRLFALLTATVALLLLGHGGLGLFEQKSLLARHYALIGLSPVTVGAFEMLLAIGVALAPVRSLLIFTALWKLATESLFLLSGAPVWEFIERAGSYVAPLAGIALLAVPAGMLRSTRALRSAPVVILILTSLAFTRGTSVRSDVPWMQRADTVWTPLSDDSLAAELRRGGLVLACRHAKTDRNRQDAAPLDLTDRTRQRNLSDAGEAQARELGDAIRALEVPLGAVLTSPLFRTRESAQLAFGRAADQDELRIDSKADLRTLLSAAPEPGTNRVLMTHNGRLMGALRVFKSSEIAEGDCAIVRPTTQHAFTILARLAPADWRRL
jgi:phosphohistidine phosphatase SixA